MWRQVLGALKNRGDMETMHGQIILGLMVLQVDTPATAIAACLPTTGMRAVRACMSVHSGVVAARMRLCVVLACCRTSQRLWRLPSSRPSTRTRSLATPKRCIILVHVRASMHVRGRACALCIDARYSKHESRGSQAGYPNLAPCHAHTLSQREIFNMQFHAGH